MVDWRATLAEHFPRAYFHLGFPSPHLAPHLELGQLGESFVARRLRSAGWRILAQKSLTPSGEIDLVALHGSTLVLVEVKSELCPIDPARWNPTNRRWRPGHRFDHGQFDVYRRALPQLQSRLPGGSAPSARIDLVEVLWRHGRWNPGLIHHLDLRAPLTRPPSGAL